MANEILDKRTLTTKCFDNGNNTKTYRLHIGHIHYKNSVSGIFEDIDTTLIPTAYGWKMEKSNYKIEIPRYVDNWFKFTNNFTLDPRTLVDTEKDEEYINIKPVGAGHVEGQLIENDRVLYKDAFGGGIDLLIVAKKVAFEKLVVINYKPSDTTKDLNFKFEVDIPNNVVLKPKKQNLSQNEIDLVNQKKIEIKDCEEQGRILEIEGKYEEARQKTALYNQKIGELEDEIEREIWDGQNPFETSQKIIFEGLRKTWVRKFRIWDSEREDSGGIAINEPLLVRYEYENEKLYFTKIVPKEILDKAKYPIYTDNATSYYAGSGDGYAADSGSGWTTVRNDTGASADDTSSYHYCRSRDNAGFFYIERGFLPVNTEGIDDGATITDAVWKLYGNLVNNQDADGYDFVTIVMGNQASTTDVVAGDYDAPGTTHQSDDVDLDNLTTSDYNDFTLNATGIGNISKTGWSKFGYREGHDVDNHQIASNVYNRVFFESSESSGKEPYLSVTTGVSAVEPSVSDSITITEDSTVVVNAPAGLETSVDNTITITENVTVRVSGPKPNTYDEITISEDSTVTVNAPITPQPNVYDGITLTEDVSVTVNASVTPTPSVDDSITITESSTVLINELVPTAYDDVTITEDVTVEVNTPLPPLKINIAGYTGVRIF